LVSDFPAFVLTHEFVAHVPAVFSPMLLGQSEMSGCVGAWLPAGANPPPKPFASTPAQRDLLQQNCESILQDRVPTNLF